MPARPLAVGQEPRGDGRAGARTDIVLGETDDADAPPAPRDHRVSRSFARTRHRRQAHPTTGDDRCHARCRSRCAACHPRGCRNQAGVHVFIRVRRVAGRSHRLHALLRRGPMLFVRDRQARRRCLRRHQGWRPLRARCDAWGDPPCRVLRRRGRPLLQRRAVCTTQASRIEVQPDRCAGRVRVREGPLLREQHGDMYPGSGRRRRVRSLGEPPMCRDRILRCEGHAVHGASLERRELLGGRTVPLELLRRNRSLRRAAAHTPLLRLNRSTAVVNIASREASPSVGARVRTRPAEQPPGGRSWRRIR
jgi:hypothetical protein